MRKLILLLTILLLLSGCSSAPTAEVLSEESISLEKADSTLLEHGFSQVVIDRLLPRHRIRLAENALNANGSNIYQVDIATHQPDEKLELRIISIKTISAENNFLRGIEYHISSEWLKAPFFGNHDSTEITYNGEMHALTSDMHPLFDDYHASAYVWDEDSTEWLLSDTFEGDFENGKISFRGVPTYKKTKYYTYFTLTSSNMRNHGINEMTLKYIHPLSLIADVGIFNGHLTILNDMDTYTLEHKIEY